ncbi:MAG: hypothetical protein GY905_13740, partial [Gammaproteobacteria bacterium]|nr:hypothetical protein [Gammaproteobacteria bacterium]
MIVAQIHTVLQDRKIYEDALYIADLTNTLNTSEFIGDVVYTASLANEQALPEWLSINPATGIISGTPAHDDAHQIHQILITATDNADSTNNILNSYYLYVENVNDAPAVPAESLYAEIHKSSNSDEVSSLVWATDHEVEDGYWWRLIDTYHQLYTDQSQIVLPTGETKITDSNPFGDSQVTIFGDLGYTSTTKWSSGIEWTGTSSRSQEESGVSFYSVVSNIGDNYVAHEVLNDYGDTATIDDYVTEIVMTLNGTVTLLGEVYEADDFIVESRYDGVSGSRVDSVSGSAVSNSRTLMPIITNEGQLGFKSEGDLGIHTLGYNGLLYIFPEQQGTYGSISFKKDGSWEYQLDETDPDTIALGIESNPLNGTVGLETFVMEVSDGEATTSETIRIEVTGGHNQITATPDNTIEGGTTADILNGDQNVNVIYGNEGDDKLAGGGEGDALYGGLGDDVLEGEDGNDILYSGQGADIVDGGAGLDEFHLVADGTWGNGYVAYNAGSSANDIGTAEQIILQGYNRYTDITDGGGTEYDCLVLTDTSDALFLEDVFSEHNANATLSKDQDGRDSTARIVAIDAILAGAGDDIIDLTSITFADSVNNITLYGEDGNDHLWGASGDDIIRGGSGDDSLIGGSGYDRLSGGDGADKFIFTATSGSNSLEDFKAAENDEIIFYYRSDSVPENLTDSDVSLWLYDNIELHTKAPSVLTWNTLDQGLKVNLDLSFSVSSGDLNDQFVLDNVSF